MNKLHIIGNVTKEPELKTVKTQNGETQVCEFDVAVNRRFNAHRQETDFFHCSAWAGLAKICSQYLHKSDKVFCLGSISARAYKTQNGDARAALEMKVD